MRLKKAGNYLLVVFVVISHLAVAQFWQVAQWTDDGNAIYQNREGAIVKTDIKTQVETTVISKALLTTATGKTLTPAAFAFNSDKTKLLVFTNTAKVWRYNTKGDYWVLNITARKLVQLGKSKAPQSLMYAKFSPDGKNVAYVTGHNLFTENIGTGAIAQLTFDGSRKLINGNFDWVYEEEFGCRDGFRWNPDGTSIAYWQVDANKIKDYFMLNTTD